MTQSPPLGTALADATPEELTAQIEAAEQADQARRAALSELVTRRPPSAKTTGLEL
jgi:hypothetical protein